MRSLSNEALGYAMRNWSHIEAEQKEATLFAGLRPQGRFANLRGYVLRTGSPAAAPLAPL